MSKVIKAYHIPQLQEEKRIISIKNMYVGNQGEVECEQLDSHQEQINIIQMHHHQLEMKEEEIEKQKREIEAYVSHCQEKVKREREQWIMEKEVLIEEAKQIGLSEGTEQGKQIGYEEYLSHLHEAKEIIKSSKMDYDNHLQHAQESIVQIAMKVAEHIVGTTLEENEASFLSFVKKVIREVQEHQNIQLRIHPKQYERVVSYKEELCELISGEIDIYIYPDEDLALYDCMIDSSFGRIDAKVDTQLQEMKLALLEMVEVKHHVD